MEIGTKLLEEIADVSFRSLHKGQATGVFAGERLDAGLE
jgi:hypothetical protein